MINKKHAYKKWLLEERACNKKYIHSPVQECVLNMCFILTMFSGKLRYDMSTMTLSHLICQASTLVLCMIALALLGLFIWYVAGEWVSLTYIAIMFSVTSLASHRALEIVC